MGLFGSRSSARSKLFVPPAGLVTSPQGLVKTVPFVFDPDQKPAVSLTKVESSASGSHGVSLVKGYQAAAAALGVDLTGLRMEVIVLVDGSGSMSYDYDNGNVQKMLVRTLGFSLNVDADGQIPVIVYGHRVNRPVDINLGNYQQAGSLIRPDFGSTNMTEAFQAAMAIAKKSDKLVMIVNITDGNPNDRVSMSNEVIASASYPVILKNLAIRSVPYLEEIDDLPSRYDIRKDGNDQPMTDAQGNLIIDENPQGIRFVDNVDSQALDPQHASEQEFAAKVTEEIGSYLEVAGRVGLLTGVPGVQRTFF